MRNILRDQLLKDLSHGEALTSEQARGVEQSARTADSARGLSGRGSANREAVQKALAGRRLKGERQTAAGNFLNLDSITKPDAFMSIVGRPSTAQGAANAGYYNPAPTAPAQAYPDTTGSAINLMNIEQQGSQFDRNFGQAQNQYNLQYQLAKNNASKYGIAV